MMTRADLTRFFEQHGIAHVTHDHPAVFRVGEGEGVKAVIPGVHTKNLFLKDAKGVLWLISAADTTVVDLKRLPAVIGSARLSFGSPELMREALGVTPGSVTAFGLVNDAGRRVRFVLDRALAEAGLVNFHPLVNTATTTVGQGDFRRFLEVLSVRPLVVDFVAMAAIQIPAIR